jgi:hypothetical protein
VLGGSKALLELSHLATAIKFLGLVCSCSSKLFEDGSNLVSSFIKGGRERLGGKVHPGAPYGPGEQEKGEAIGIVA